MAGAERKKLYQITILEGMILCTITFSNTVSQQSAKLRNSHAALRYGFVNSRQPRTNQISQGIKHHLIVFVVSQSYCRHFSEWFLLQK